MLDVVRSSNRRAIEDVDRFLRQARSAPLGPVVGVVEARQAVQELHRVRCEGTEQEAVAARRALAQLAREIVRPYGPPACAQPRAMRIGARVEGWVNRVSEGLSSSDRRERLVRRLGRRWTAGWFAASLAAGALLVAGQLSAALLVLAARAGASLFVLPPGLPADLSVRRRYLRVDWRACVLSHLTDGLLLCASGLYLLLQQRPVWGVATLLVSLVMLASTLARVAALQDGHWRPRLRIERLFRTGVLMVGLAGTVWVQGGVPIEEPPLLALGAAGALAFAALESVRTLYYARQERRQRAERPTTDTFLKRVAAVAIALDSDGTLEVA